MAAISEEIPLWRIHNLGTGSGTTHNIVNIARPDTIALLRHLGEGDPIKATGHLVLAADYKLDPATLREATLVRIEKVFADPTGKDSLNAELLVLCKCRVKDVVISDPFPRASRLPDLAPLWRIHGFDPIRNSTFMSNEDVKIENISRPDTVSLLTALGGGDVTRATGHLVIACNFKDDLGVDLEAVLARIGTVSEGDPPLTCSLRMLGRIRCAEVTTEGPFPQVLMEEVPVWRIHNLATSTLTEHKITNIARPDSLALLAYLGRGNPLAAIGSLVIACDFKTPPCAGDSATLMRITVVKGGQGKYDAELVEVSSTDVGRMRTDVGRADWWPRVTIELPKIWSKPVVPRTVSPMPGKPSTNPQVISPLKGREELGYLSPGKELKLRVASECPYWQRCFKVLNEIVQNAGIQLNEFADPIADRCFCSDCHKQRGDVMVYKRGGRDYILPVGFARVGIKPHKTASYIKMTKAFELWHVCYHGTQSKCIGDLLVSGQLLAPGLTTFRSSRIAVRPGHIEDGFERTNEHTGTSELFNPTNKIFFSPSIKYCDYKGVYMTEHPSMGRKYRFALQLRLQPETYSIGQETVNATEQIDPHIPNTSIEWYTHQIQAHFFTGIVIGER